MFTFPYMWDKRRSMATSLFDDFQPVVSAGDFTGDRSTKCWSIPESLLALVFFSLGVYFYAFSLFTHFVYTWAYVCIAFYCLPYTTVVLDLLLIGWVLLWGKRPNTQARVVYHRNPRNRVEHERLVDLGLTIAAMSSTLRWGTNKGLSFSSRW